jgi:alkanesulfonate monooxygenase SsuD/methylene tetrahydromethanopterin reductase-like flavin-dependent oxidoreductase (luciferase family)
MVKRAIDVGLFGELADPRVALAAVACATSRVRIGALR